jgi:hypothetical protein
MDQRIKSAARKIKDKLKGTIKTEEKEFKGLLKEDKKLDKERDALKKKAR